MAFSVHFKIVENSDQKMKMTPWLCDKCHAEEKVLLKIHVDYDILVLCKRCLMEAKKLITNRERELKDGKDSCNN